MVMLVLIGDAAPYGDPNVGIDNGEPARAEGFAARIPLVGEVGPTRLLINASILSIGAADKCGFVE